MSYHQFMADDGTEYGSFEVFAVSPLEVQYNKQNADHADEFTIFEAGWYWWPCYPDCLPDGDAIGPFDTKVDAIADARCSS
mgnify:CR=1 FL=1